MERENEIKQTTDALVDANTFVDADALVDADILEDVDTLVAQPLQEIDFSAVEEALVPDGDDREDLPDIFSAMPDKPY